MDAWIEIAIYHAWGLEQATVASYMDAWIEIQHMRQQAYKPAVASYMDAWIEIMTTTS